MKGDIQQWAEALHKATGKWPSRLVGPVTNNGNRFTIHVRYLNSKTLNRNRLQRLYSQVTV